MKLYYSPGACSLADHIALIESGLPFETVKVDLKTKRTEDGSDYTKVNPKGYVPALALDDGEILTENIAVLSFIADASGKLMPPEGMAHWRVLETAAYVSSELHKNYKPFFTLEATDGQKAAAREMLAKRFAILEERLAEHSFIVGDDMTIADCYLFVMLLWAKTKAKIDVPPRLSAYYDRVQARPSVQKALAEEGLA